MTRLEFPAEAVGLLDWPGRSRDDSGPVLARGTVDVPDGADIGLSVHPVGDVERLATGGWHVGARPGPVDLAFLARLPPTALYSLDFFGGMTGPLDPVLSIAPGLHSLGFGHPELHNEALAVIAQLHELTTLQTWDNHYTDDGVQQLERLQLLERLYLEEATLTAAAFAFAARLPRLRRLGVLDVPLSDAELAALRSRLPGVDVRE